ncbi:hypothetical protein EJ08DRAFT_142882 [Tothia fuscella]|uniref:C3H1-type domain-containing protein n=1 Tax=Tothia fuscella TaxID=1048955 RepID=A0A9P4U467_9PEZI|nr:hypothetical protein EJ08DRAFT_142882 [Tothia fuscella]
MALHTTRGHPATPWLTASWRDKALQPRPQVEPRYILDCNNGAFVPLRPTQRSNHGYDQVLVIDEDLCPDIDIRIGRAERMSRGRQEENQNRERSGSGRPPITPGDFKALLGGVSDGMSTPGSSGARHRESDVQSRIDEITASHLSKRSAPSAISDMNEPMSILAAVAASNPEAAARYNYRPTPSGRDVSQDGKIYCTYWIRHGECDYMQQGCRYKHEMPDSETLRTIGFQSVPRWFREKTSMAAARSMRPTLGFRDMIAGKKVEALPDSSSSDEASSEDRSSSSSQTQVEKAPIADVIRKPLLQHASSTGSCEPRIDTRADSPMLLDLNDETAGLEIPMSLPLSTPTSSAFRQGRFIPAGEAIPSPTRQQVGTPRGSTEKPSPTPTPLPSFKRSAPTFKHYFESGAELPDTQNHTPSNPPPSPVRSDQHVAEPSKLQQENEALRAKLQSLKLQAQVVSKSSAQPSSSAQSLPRTGLMASKHCALGREQGPRSADKKEKVTPAPVTSSSKEKAKSASARTSASPKTVVRKRRVATSGALLKREAVAMIKKEAAVAVAAGEKGKDRAN